MSIAHVQSKTGYQNGGDTTIPVSFNAAPTEGNLLVLCFISGGQQFVTPPTGYTRVTGQNTSFISSVYCYKIAGASETTAQGDVGTNTADQVQWAMHEYSATGGWATDPTMGLGQAGIAAGMNNYRTEVDSGYLGRTFYPHAVMVAGARMRNGTADVTTPVVNNGYTLRATGTVINPGAASLEALYADRVVSTAGLSIGTEFSWDVADTRQYASAVSAVFYEDGQTIVSNPAPYPVQWREVRTATTSETTLDVVFNPAPAEGDLILIYTGTSYTAGANINTITNFTELTEIAGTASAVTNSSVQYKVAGAAEGTTYQVTTANASSIWAIGVVVRNMDTAAPIQSGYWSTNENTSFGTSLSVSATSNSLADGWLGIGMFMIDQSNEGNTFDTTPGWMTRGVEQSGSTTPANKTTALNFVEMTSTATLGMTGTFGQSSRYHAIVLGIALGETGVPTSGTINSGGGISATVVKRINQIVRPTSTVSASTWDTGPTAGQSLHGYTSDDSDTTYIYDPVA